MGMTAYDRIKLKHKIKLEQEDYSNLDQQSKKSSNLAPVNEKEG
jgi:hypothetical protein